MKNFNSHRVFKRNDYKPVSSGDYVLYWMQINRRFHYNFALEYAVGWANKLGKPLLILEAFSCDYSWATDRSHTFMMQGMKEHLDYATNNELNYVSFVENEPGQYDTLLKNLASHASVLITDEYPVFIMRKRNETYPKKLELPYITVDSNGLIPLGLTEKDPYSAYIFRKIMQKNFIEAFTNPPLKNPLKELNNREEIQLATSCFEDLPEAEQALNNISEFIADLNIDHSVPPVDLNGTRQAALGILGHFIKNSLPEYDEKRNHPDEKKTSQLSPWLHFGKISEYEIVYAVLKHQPEGWDLDKITFNNGSAGGFFNGNPNIDSFLDEVITWREVGFHFAHHRDDYDQFESLPDWALKTMEEHKDDPRGHMYSYEELAQSKTNDEVWNAAQTQLREEGIIHNYLRMLWGKKVIEWTPDYRTALEYLIELNNTYAIDGRDPNSYSGIFWCFGRFDRAWQERSIFGKLRYMTSYSTRKKVKLQNYMETYGTKRSSL
ncbi:deoxyribodipyrimidine photolyase [soil metagenome]